MGQELFCTFIIVLIKDNKNFLNANNIKITVQIICELASSFKKSDTCLNSEHTP